MIAPQAVPIKFVPIFDAATVQADPKYESLNRLAGIIGPHEHLMIKQQFEFLEACFGCEQKNSYHIESPDGKVILIAKENSSCCTRVFCNPNHSLMVEVSLPDSPDDVLFTLERPGVECCGGAKPCLCCPACCAMCQEEAIMHGGKVEGTPGNISAPNPLVMMRQASAAESPFNPKINVNPMDADGKESKTGMSLTGPQFFGGCSELCCKSTFPVRYADNNVAGEVVKLPPRNFCGCLAEMATDMDTYKVDFNPGLSAEDKAAILSSAILADYMFFEGDEGMCRRKPNGETVCTLCQCYCLGCILPCNLKAPKKGGPMEP
mmetsp:Transcript_20218/g.37723  ORF Transcript_20218/g.37723 Transcript_20218/m.37723 type:complete len:320 (-) Transcript_20218:174-1133(-)|eukprot:CAMPEP_0182493130 /NCGR_PEP_ID=MMETSP1321-20130603/2146_1 /TAXON_ID=91990 /ORGANISM="Bolidomonas sp., Strain RCC1657" /LENGTH=319 /DNA_ID=CAMNT_0024695813 /DNA_START=91 /DNA_END=1050 /DNA_ORIENTATION=-